jgi:hypothetical protein
MCPANYRQPATHLPELADPIPNAPPHASMPGLEMWSRDGLKQELEAFVTSFNRRLKEYMADIRSNPQGVQSGIVPPDPDSRWVGEVTLQAEWDRRVVYWSEQQRLAAAAAHQANVATRNEVIALLMTEGKARHVAEELTNTEAKFLAEGKRFRIF